MRFEQMFSRVVSVVSLLVILPIVTGEASASSYEASVGEDETRQVDVVICLDTSGSMKDLLDSARARVWDVVNELARMRPTPELRVGLLSYGTDSSTADAGWITLHLDLTDDLDAVYAELMALTIGGGEEFVGRVLDAALDEMSWSPNWNSLRIVFVTGNESADQGVDHHDFRVAARAARDEDIIINALYAGNREQGISEQWHEVARQANGNFSAIDPATGTIQIPTPQDDRLLELNALLNLTYLPYGVRGQDGLVNQVAQDRNASRLGVQSCSSRIVAKGSALYTNASWDLVDASLEEGFDWDALALQDLPESMRSMTNEQRQALIEKRRAKRESIQQEIQRISAEREAYIKAAFTREPGATGLGGAMLEAIREQATAKGFRCDGC
jgi:hypothetical protein